MSTIPSQGRIDRRVQTGWRGRAVRLLYALLPFAAAATVGYVLLAEELTPPRDLWVLAPSAIPPGSPLPLRAVVFEDSPARPLADPVETRIVARVVRGDREVAAPTVLGRSQVLGAEGVVDLGGEPEGELLLIVEAQGRDGRITRAERPLHIAEGASSAMQEVDRAPLATFAAGPLQRSPVGEPLDRLTLVQPTGACVPELPCVLTIETDAPSVELRAPRSVEVSTRPTRLGEGSFETTVVVRASEASVELVAMDESTVLARRSIRLALASGGVVVDAPPVTSRRRIPLAIRALEDGPIAVDVFRLHRTSEGFEATWVHAASFAGQGEVTLEGLSLDEGLHAAQVERHLFARSSAEAVGVAAFDVVDTEAESEAPPALERAEVAGRIVPPPPIFGSDRLPLEQARAERRLVAVAVALFAGFLASFLLIRRGLAAETEAAALTDTSPRERGVGQREVWAYGLLVFLGFLALAVFASVYGG